ncbi:MAG: hypothetical protein A3G13_02455 [Candidatus Levybacteria bacterium RIFCSPLOWO2_12_FULL_37_7]|nr:MAG: hypothetical protein A3G13_02455 [Candidatus Levybacteria bacterium RIFCSPLOWO2_12_FULL_37_7]
MHKLLYHPSVLKKLKRIHQNDRKRILNKLELLSKNPKDTNLDIKHLVNTKNSFRLRAGDIRAIFEIDNTQKIIYIWNIDYRGSIY